MCLHLVPKITNEHIKANSLLTMYGPPEAVATAKFCSV